MRSRPRGRSSGSPPRCGAARTGEVWLTRLLALAALSPAQAVEVGAGLLAVVELDQARGQGDPDDGGPAVDRITVDVDGRVAIVPPAGRRLASGPGRGSRARVMRPCSGSSPPQSALRSARATPRTPGSSTSSTAQWRSCPWPVWRRSGSGWRRRAPPSTGDAVRAELGALVRALAESTGTARPGGAVRSGERARGPLGKTAVGQAPDEPRAPGSGRGCSRSRSSSRSSLLEVVLLRDDIAADIDLLLDAGRSGSAAVRRAAARRPAARAARAGGGREP